LVRKTSFPRGNADACIQIDQADEVSASVGYRAEHPTALARAILEAVGLDQDGLLYRISRPDADWLTVTEAQSVQGRDSSRDVLATSRAPR